MEGFRTRGVYCSLPADARLSLWKVPRAEKIAAAAPFTRVGFYAVRLASGAH